MVLKLRYWVRLLSAFSVRFRGIIFIGIIVGLFLFAAIRYFAPVVLSREVEYVGVTGRHHTENLPYFVLNLVGEGLTKLNEKGEVEPAIAESWQEEDEGKTWIFHLKQGLKWHDGTPVTSSTIQYSFEDAAIERPDENTIIFKLSSPFSPFPSVVSKPTFKKGLLGTGTWRVKNVSLASSFVEELVLIDAKGSQKVIRFYPSEDSSKLAFQLGEVDSLVDILDPYPFEDWSGVTIDSEINQNRFVAVFFNNETDPFKENKSLRQALSYAVPKTEFEGPRALGPISPNSWAYNPQVKEYAHDIKRAQELIDEMPDELQDSININLTTTPALLEVADKVAKAWNEIGIKTNVLVVSIIPEDYQAFLAIYDMPIDPDQYTIWHSSQTETNISKYYNIRINTLLEDGRTELDPAERKRIYLDFQRFLLEDAPAVFLYHPTSYTVSRK